MPLPLTAVPLRNQRPEPVPTQYWVPLVVVVSWALAGGAISNAAARTAGTTTSRLNPEQIHRTRDGFMTGAWWKPALRTVEWEGVVDEGDDIGPPTATG